MRKEKRTMMHAKGVRAEPESSVIKGHSSSSSLERKGTAQTASDSTATHLFSSGQYLHSTSLNRHSSQPTKLEHVAVWMFVETGTGDSMQLSASLRGQRSALFDGWHTPVVRFSSRHHPQEEVDWHCWQVVWEWQSSRPEPHKKQHHPPRD